jgi:hypothetical protein
VILKSSPGEYSNSSNFIITDAKMRERAVGLLRKLEKNGENNEGKWGERQRGEMEKEGRWRDINSW